jgi:nitroreductase
VIDVGVADELLSTTRAVRRRLDLERPVDPELLLECLRMAVQAPTGTNSQGWRWVVVTDPGRRAELARLYAAGSSGYMARMAVEHPDAQTRRVYSSADFLLGVLDQVPVHVVACVEGRIDSDSNFRAATLYGSILPAVWSFMLAARARGLGTVWTTLHLAHEAEAAEVLGIPEGWSQVALVPVAHTVGTDFQPATRPPVEEITFWDSWGSTRS